MTPAGSEPTRGKPAGAATTVPATQPTPRGEESTCIKPGPTQASAEPNRSNDATRPTYGSYRLGGDLTPITLSALPISPDSTPTRIAGTGPDDDTVEPGRRQRETGKFQGVCWGDFQLGPLLGEGGMGAVYHGRQISLDRPVAIKVLPAQVSKDEVFRGRFQREARAVAAISSPHVVQIIHAGSHFGHEFFVMELVKGTDLSRRLRSGWRATREEAIELLTQAARGLAAAARHGIVHRDIKPANMLLAQDGTLKLTDFGLARTVGDQQQLTAAGTIMGTMSYMSPEQARSADCDHRSDLYSLGVVFFELLTGRAPFIAADAEGVIYQHLHEPAPDPRRFSPRVDAGCAAVAQRLLAKEPVARYQTAEELIADLDRLRRNERPLAARHRRWPLVAGAAALALAAGAGAALLLRPSPAAAVAAGAPATAAAVVEPEPPTAPPRTGHWPTPAPPPPPANPVKPATGTRPATAPPSRIRQDSYGRYVDVALAEVPFRLRECPAGSFTLGSPKDEPDRSRNEVPHQVTLRAFWAAETEVTQAQWSAVMAVNPSRYPGADRPVERVARTDAQEFLNRLAALEAGFQPRLPTEAEWEYACRAGSQTPFANGRALPTLGWYERNSGGQSHAVKGFQPNAWGLFDCHGNVSEWTADGLHDYPDYAVENPRPVTEGNPAIRGGSFADDAEDCRSARRDSARKPSDRIGFRFVVDTLPPAWR